MEGSILQDESTFIELGVEMSSRDVAGIVDSTSRGNACSGVIDLGELSIAEQISMFDASPIAEATNDVATSIDPTRPSH